MKNTLYILLLLLCPVLFVQCQKDETAGVGEEVDVTFTARISDVQFSTKAMGDGSKVDKLSVGLFDKHGNLVWRNEDDIQISVSSPATVKVPMFKGREYDVVFWAQSSECTSYNTDDLTAISITYGSGSINDYATIEQLDAFYCLKTGVSHNTADKTITLTRPFTQLNMGVPVSVLEELESSGYSIGSVKLTVGGVADEFNALTGVKSGDETFTFTFNTLPDGIEKVKNDKGEEIDYKYLATTYLFASEDKVSATLEVFNGNETEPFSTVSYEDTPAEPNERTSIFGNIETPILKWDGNIDKDGVEFEGSKCTIKTPQGLAWLSENPTDSRVLDCDEFILEKSMDMGAKSETPLTLLSIKLPIVEKGTVFDGNGKKLQNININGNSLFADASKLTVENLTVTNITVDKTSATEVTHVGSLVNILKGGGTFSNVTVKDAVVTTGNGAAGGLVGYVCPESDGSASEVIFDNSHVNNSTVKGTRSEGHFVGLLRGFNNTEKLIFNTSCTSESTQTSSVSGGFVSPYREGNEGRWLAGNDYTKFNGWLGDEEKYRGTVIYGVNRFIPCWDGSTKVTPLTEGTTKLIYSAYDLASLQGTAAGNIKLMENVDMEYDLDGASKDGVRNHIFTALSTLAKLEGNGKTIYNISIRDNYYGGFVKSESCATTFENVTFDGADIRVTHDTEEGNAYVGTLRGFAYATTTINNVHVKNGYLNGVCKMGGLCGGIFAKITCSNSSVQNYKFENYDSEIINKGFKANGEIGGLIGYITVLDASTVNEISTCSVQNNSFNCVTYSASLWDRSVAPFIGDIRTQKAGTVSINNCQILGDNTYTNASTGKTATFDRHRKKTGGSWLNPTYTYYPLVGQCYAVFLLDNSGKVYIDNTQIF